jgi:uncharacterized cupredoxin-like copper-binding protein
MLKFPVLVAICLAGAALVAASASQAAPRSSTLITTVNVTAGKPSEFKFTLSKKSSKRGIVIFKVKNAGSIGHDFTLCSKSSSSLANSCNGRSTKTINPGQTATLRVSVLRAGTYEYLCTVPGHAAAGMKGLLKVT